MVGREQLKLLLDTHTLIWWFLGLPKLSQRARKAIDRPNASVYVSAATGWELATKYRSGRLQNVGPLVARMPEYLSQWHFQELPVTMIHSLRAGMLLGEHGDPFDRMLAAQALVEGLVLITSDEKLAGLGPKTLW